MNKLAVQNSCIKRVVKQLDSVELTKLICIEGISLSMNVFQMQGIAFYT
jgi:hypothetical protein